MRVGAWEDSFANEAMCRVSRQARRLSQIACEKIAKAQSPSANYSLPIRGDYRSQQNGSPPISLQAVIAQLLKEVSSIPPESPSRLVGVSWTFNGLTQVMEVRRTTFG